MDMPPEERNFKAIDPAALGTLYFISSVGPDPADQLHIYTRVCHLRTTTYDFFSLGGLRYHNNVTVLVNGEEVKIRAVLAAALRARASRVLGCYYFWADGLDKLQFGIWPRYYLVREILTYACCTLCILGAPRATGLRRKLSATVRLVAHIWKSTCKRCNVSPTDPLYYLTFQERWDISRALIPYRYSMEAIDDLTQGEIKAMFLSAY
ncbi:hypothetical protein F4803DRAFT_568609 [Xylaria telfairii]|nr:hypothetical protein F4803DRAFT_568609 [Xylaria telfairii]